MSRQSELGTPSLLSHLLFSPSHHFLPIFYITFLYSMVALLTFLDLCGHKILFVHYVGISFNWMHYEIIFKEFVITFPCWNTKPILPRCSLALTTHDHKENTACSFFLLLLTCLNIDYFAAVFELIYIKEFSWSLQKCICSRFTMKGSSVHRKKRVNPSTSTLIPLIFYFVLKCILLFHCWTL